MRTLRRLIQLLCAALVASLVPSIAHAQEDESNPLGTTSSKKMILIGPVIGTGLSNHTGNFQVLNDKTCPVFRAGGGWGFMAGLTAEIQAGKSWGIVPRIVYESRPGHFKEHLQDANILVDSVTQVPQVVSATSDVKYQFVSLEVMYALHLAQLGKSFRLNLNVGPTAGYVLVGKITQVQDLEAPLNARFTNPDGLVTENNGRRLVYLENQEIDGLNKFRFSLKGGLVGELGLFNNEWIMYPGIFYDFGLAHVTKRENWNLNTFVAQLEFRHAF